MSRFNVTLKHILVYHKYLAEHYKKYEITMKKCKSHLKTLLSAFQINFNYNKFVFYSFINNSFMIICI